MKFLKLRMLNFMRYKGENIIKFSQDNEKNVTVVLGDNTVGKTTLAQAFRWGLYGELINTQYEESKRMCILNNEVLGDMTANDYGNVEVELVLENKSTSGNAYQYRIIRKAIFRRKFPQMVANQTSELLKMYITDIETGETIPYDNGADSNRGKVDDIISELLPRDLSSYFLFDGERWSNEKNTVTDIKDSIYTLVGISPIREMKRHLGECGPSGKASVIKQLKSKITGSGNEYNEILDKIYRYESFIEREEKNIIDAKENVISFQEKVDSIEILLHDNPNVEQDQKEYERLGKEIQANNKRMKTYYADIVTSFSSSHKYFAAPLLQEVIDLLQGIELEGMEIELERVDVPGVTDKTIDFLLDLKECICGNEILHNSAEESCLLKLRKVVPPAVIGSLISGYKNKMNHWVEQSADLYEEIKEKSILYNDEFFELTDNEEKLEQKRKKIDKKINFANERIKLNANIKKVNEEKERIRKAELNIQYYKDEIKKLENQRSTLDEKTETNNKLKRLISYAEELYAESCKIYNSKKNNILNELNELIDKNFREMFNEQEKVAKLGEDYILRLFYKRVSNKNGYADLEATGLSEGEKIARNFAFIVSILELANKKKMEGDEVAQSLPLVLDGPFSKLSSINTSKVAKVLPAVSDQVIIFMLDKDWEPSGLEEYTGYKYRTEKDINGNSSTIVAIKEVE